MAKISEKSLKNLKPLKKGEKRTKEIASKGGYATNELQRQRRKAKECMNMILETGATGKGAKALMDKLGIDEKEQQNIMLLMASMFTKAVSTGDPSAVKAILEIAGDLDVQTDQLSPTININISAATEEDIDDE